MAAQKKRLSLLLMYIAVSTIASAGTLTLQPTPDIFSSQLSVSYNAATGALTVNGFADGLTDDVSGTSTTFPISNGNFSLTAQISNLGAATSGTLDIAGCVSALPGQPGCLSASRLLIAQTLTSFWFSPIPDGELIFGLTNLSGDLQPRYGNEAYVKMNLFGFPGSFAGSFSTSDFSNVSDTGVIPEPSMWVLLLSGTGLLGLARRRGTAV